MSAPHRVEAPRRSIVPLAALVLAALSASAGAASWRDLDGSYAVTGPNPFTSTPGSAEDTHLRLQFRGPTARDLWNAMHVEPGVDECTGAAMKAVDSLRCVYFEKDRTYQCDFSIELAVPRIDVGLPC